MIRDLVRAIRALCRSPGYSLAVVLTLALGIGGTAAVACVLRSVLLRLVALSDDGRPVVAAAVFTSTPEVRSRIAAVWRRPWKLIVKPCASANFTNAAASE